MSDVLGTLRRFASNSELLSLLDEHGLQRLSLCAVTEHYDADEDIVIEGEPGDCFYLITEGEVGVHVAEVGREVARLGQGAFFGEMAVMMHKVRSATVRAVADTELLAFSRFKVAPILDDYPKAREMLGRVGLERTEENLQHLMSDEILEEETPSPPLQPSPHAQTQLNDILKGLRDAYEKTTK